jgi:hypothetical protein
MAHRSRYLATINAASNFICLALLDGGDASELFQNVYKHSEKAFQQVNQQTIGRLVVD